MGEWMENENLVDWNKVWWLDEKKWFRALALQAKNKKIIKKLYQNIRKGVWIWGKINM